MKYSKQRELIREFVGKERIHATADQIYSQVRKVQPSISLGTVYRNLNLLAELGEIRKISLPNQSDRFDCRLDEHQHMICDVCGQVYDVDLDILQGLDDYVRAQTGFSVSSKDLIIRGSCPTCVQ